MAPAPCTPCISFSRCDELQELTVVGKYMTPRRIEWGRSGQLYYDMCVSRSMIVAIQTSILQD